MNADVRSIDAVREWHAALVNYGDSLSEAMAGVELEIRRGFDWLQEQLDLWKRAVRDCEQEVTQAKAELSSRKFQGWDDREPDTTVQERALRRAKARLEHAEDQVEKVRAWIGRLPKMVEEIYYGSSHRMRNFLEIDLPKGLAVLARRIEALESYAGLRVDYAPAPSTTSLANPPTPLASPPNPPSPFPRREGGADLSPPSRPGEGDGGLGSDGEGSGERSQ